VSCSNEKSISRENISTTVYLLRNWQSDICASEVNTNSIMLEINDNMFLYNTNFSLRMSIYTCTPEYGSCRCFYFNTCPLKTSSYEAWKSKTLYGVVKIKIKIKSRVLKRKLKAIKHLKILLM
jgi:hypothetical protein